MRTREQEVEHERRVVWHRYNGLKVREFAERVGVTEKEVHALIGNGWFARHGRAPELMDMGNGTVQWWSISPAAADRFLAEKPMRDLMQWRRDQAAKRERGVYIIRSEEGPRRYKIGITVDLPSRFLTLQTMSPVALSVVAFIPRRYRKMEQRLHAIFAAHRRHGEWFDESPALLYLIGKYRHSGEEAS